jgi:Tfp pilus assembly protein PilZ
MNFKAGDLVLCEMHALSSKAKKYSAKLSNKWSSPLLIAQFLTGVTVQLAKPETGVKVKKAHVTHLKRYFPAE